jgi:DNA repair photolyase
MADGIRPYAGEFLVSPAGLELSMNWCGHACTYCFANLFKPDRRADIRGIVGLLSEHHKRKSREARLMQARVPLLVSNHVDPLAGTNAVQFEPIWEMCVELGIPLTWQTRGAHKAHLRIQERIIRETPRAVWYVSIPMLDDDVRKRVEPHAPSIGSRLELIDQLIERGHVVTVGVNPLSVEWMPRFEPLLDQLKAKGVWGVWIQIPYFSKSFKGNLSEKARGRLGDEFIRRCGEKGSKDDRAHAAAAMAYAKNIGLEVFSTEYEEPTRFFDPWHTVYERTMPYWHQLVNVIDPLVDDPEVAEDGYVVVTREFAQEVLSPLPEADWSEPLRHKRAKHYRAIVQPLPDGRLPKQDVAGFWRIMWNDDLFCKSLGPTSFRRFAHASVTEGDRIIPLLDSSGDRLVVYRREGWRYTLAETPELS